MTKYKVAIHNFSTASALFFIALFLLSACQTPGGKPTHSSDASDMTAADGERLIMTLPGEWVLGHHDQKKHVESFEFVPKGQTVHNWTDMISIGMIPVSNLQNASVFDRASAVQNYFIIWKEELEKICEDTRHKAGNLDLTAMNRAILDGKFTCTKGLVTGKGEVILYRIITGRDGHAVILRQWALQPFNIGQEPVSSSVLGDWKNRLEQIRLCDPRLSVCPPSQFSF